MISDNISHQGRKTKVTRVFGGRLTFKLPSLTKVSNSFRSRPVGGWVEPEQVDTGYGVMSSGEFSFIKLKFYLQSRSPHITLLDQSIKNINDKKKQ